MFYVFKKIFHFFLFFKSFLSYFYCCVQNYKYDAFLVGKLRLVLFSICTIITVTTFSTRPVERVG